MPSTSHWSDEAIASLSKSIAALHRAVRVAVIEDNQDDITIMANLMEGYPCEINPFTTSADFKNFIDAKPAGVDLALLDLKIGHENGLELIKYCRFRGLNTPFVVITGYYDDAVVSVARELGAVTVLRKPPTREEIKSIFGNLLNK